MNIFISNLSYAVETEDLMQLFAEYGSVKSAKVITDKFTGKSRGFGFVEMHQDADGQKAIEELNGAEYDGKVILVAVAKPRTDKPRFNNNKNGNYNNYERKNNRY